MDYWALIILNPVVNVLEVLTQALFNSFGLAIIALTILTRVLMYPLTVKQLRATKAIDPNQDVIVMTGYASTETAVESMKLGASDYITKPFNLDQIKIVVAKTLERSRLQKKAEEGEIYKQLSRVDGLTELYNYTFFQQLYSFFST